MSLTFEETRKSYLEWEKTRKKGCIGCFYYVKGECENDVPCYNYEYNKED